MFNNYAIPARLCGNGCNHIHLISRLLNGSPNCLDEIAFELLCVYFGISPFSPNLKNVFDLLSIALMQNFCTYFFNDKVCFALQSNGLYLDHENRLFELQPCYNYFGNQINFCLLLGVGWGGGVFDIRGLCKQKVSIF